MEISESTAVRCAAWAREEAVDPIGTAGSYAGFLLLEWPLPWPRDVSDVPELRAVNEAVAAAGLRLQGLVPIFGDEEARRVIRYTRPLGPGFSGFERAERLVPVERVEDAAVELAQGGEGDPDWARADVTDDVLVCTHGKRDTCCGAQGTALFLALSGDPGRFGGTVRLWRTSHTGGHRFAPTAIVLPQGTVWAFMDAEALRRVTRREGPLDDLLPRYRGSPGMDSRELQALERAAFGAVGWGWLDWQRAGEELGGGRFGLTGRSPSGERRRWEATVEVARMVPVPDCGLPIEAAKKAEPELVLRDLASTT